MRLVLSVLSLGLALAGCHGGSSSPNVTSVVLPASTETTRQQNLDESAKIASELGLAQLPPYDETLYQDFEAVSHEAGSLAFSVYYGGVYSRIFTESLVDHFFFSLRSAAKRGGAGYPKYDKAFSLTRSLGRWINASVANSSYYLMLQDYYLTRWLENCQTWSHNVDSLCNDNSQLSTYRENYKTLRQTLSEKIERLKALDVQISE